MMLFRTLRVWALPLRVYGCRLSCGSRRIMYEVIIHLCGQTVRRLGCERSSELSILPIILA